MTDLRDALAARCEDFDGEKWSKEKIGKAFKDKLSQQLEKAFGLLRKNHSGVYQYTLRPVPENLRTPTMLGVEGDSAFNAHAGDPVRAPVSSPPTPPTSQNLFGKAGETGGGGGALPFEPGPAGPAEDDGWDCL
jgi:hypothetical protein